MVLLGPMLVSRDRYNGMVRFNYNPDKYNMYASYNVRRDKIELKYFVINHSGVWMNVGLLSQLSFDRHPLRICIDWFRWLLLPKNHLVYLAAFYNDADRTEVSHVYSQVALDRYRSYRRELFDNNLKKNMVFRLLQTYFPGKTYIASWMNIARAMNPMIIIILHLCLPIIPNKW